MTKTRDENDRAVDGNLPDDPEADTEPVGADGKPAPSVLEPHWKTLADHNIDITKPPPQRRWLLRMGQEGPGALPLGKAGVLAAGGGTGKTMALVQLALAVATGGYWLGTFRVESPGRVLLGLGEEEAEEVHRRFYRAARAAGMSSSEAASRIVALPLAGTPVSLTQKDAKGNITESPVLAELRERLSKSDDWRLIVLDPLSRWAGDDAEKDNAAATRFVQAAESLVRSPGNPTVLVAHHSSAQSISRGESGVRGVTGIVDGFRWAAALDKVVGEDTEGVRLRLLKSNYTKPWTDVYLVRPDEHNGAFVRASDTQREALQKGAKSADDEAARLRAEAAKDRAAAAKQDAATRARAEDRRAATAAAKGKRREPKREEGLY